MRCTNIEFTNEDGLYDETQFDTTDRDELASCWFEFCIENNLITLEEVEVYE